MATTEPLHRTDPTQARRRSRRLTHLSAALLLTAACLPAPAQTANPTVGGPTTAATETTAPSATAPFTTALASRLQDLYPSTRFGAIHATAWPGVFEVTMGANLAYVDASGQYFLFGHLFDMKAQRDLTAERKDTLARVDFDALPLADAIREVRGNGSRVLAIFADPDCPYCRKLEVDLRELTNVTIYTFLMPLVSLHPTAHRRSVSIWCAQDRLAAWQATMWRGEEVATLDCPHPVDRNVMLGERLGINGTPTLIAADGRMLAGAAGKEQIEAWLQRPSTQAQGATSSKVPAR